MTCICFHNICIIHGDTFDMDQAKKIEQEMYLKNINNLLQQFQHINIFHAMDKVIK